MIDTANGCIESYGYVLLAVGTISIVQYGIGGSVMGLRKKLFRSPEFLNKPAVKMMQEQHKRAFGTGINNNGYPDMGNGRYSEQLEYAEWVEFNNAQRAHNNMLEVSGTVLTTLVLNGLFQPVVSAGLGFVFAFGRILYSIGYNSKSGADGRTTGAVIASIATYGLYLMSFYNGLKLAGIVKF